MHSRSSGQRRVHDFNPPSTSQLASVSAQLRIPGLTNLRFRFHQGAGRKGNSLSRPYGGSQKEEQILQEKELGEALRQRGREWAPLMHEHRPDF